MGKAVTIAISIVLFAVAFSVSTVFGAVPDRASALLALGKQGLQKCLHDLSVAQTTQAQSLAGKDATLQALVQGFKYQTSSVESWTELSGKPLGAVMKISFKKPVTIKGTWLILDYNCAENSTKLAGRKHWYQERTNVSFIRVFVDLRHEQILGIEPDENAGFPKGSDFVGALPVIKAPTGTYLSKSCRGE